MTRKIGNGLDLLNGRIENVASPSAATDATNKDYVDNVARGLDWKEAVRAASTANVSVANGLENGDVVDGVALVTGDRVLLKDQAAGAENGIYVVVAAGAAARAVDADSSAEVTAGMAVSVTEGTVNADRVFNLTTNNPIVLGTTALTFSQLGGGSSYTAGNGLTLSGADFNVGQGTGIAVNANDVAIDPAVVVRKFAASIGDTAATSFNVDHNLGTLDVTVAVFANADGTEVLTDVVHSTINRVIVSFASAPTSNQYRVVVHG